MTNSDDRLGNNRDDIYSALIAAHGDLSPEESAALDARLILLMINEIGDRKTLESIFEAAKTSLKKSQ